MVKRRFSLPPPTPRKRQRTSSTLVGGPSMGYSKMSSVNFYPTKMSRVNVLNKSALRAAMTVKGRRPKVKRGKKVKVSKTFRAKVQKVNAGLVPYGEYRTCHVGNLGFLAPGTAALTGVQTGTYSAQDGTTQLGYVYPGTDMPTYARTLFGALYTTGVNSAAYISGTDMYYFTPLKILDAASKLWNQKTVDDNSFATLTGNLSTSMVKTTGLPDTAFTAPNSLKIEVVNSYVTWEMKNISQRPVRIIVHEMTPKLKYVVSSPLDNIKSVLNLNGDSTSEQRTIGIFEGVVSTTNPDSNYGLVDPLLNLPSLDGLAWKKGQRRDILIQPGETCLHSIKGPRRIVVDYGKLQDGSNEYQDIGVKGYSVACFVEVMIDPELTNQALQFGMRPTNRTATVGVLNDPVQVTVTEVMKLRCPEVVGFMTPQTFAGNTQQLLNMRKKRIHIENWSQAQGAAAITYTGFNEEVPATTINNALSF